MPNFCCHQVVQRSHHCRLNEAVKGTKPNNIEKIINVSIKKYLKSLKSNEVKRIKLFFFVFFRLFIQEQVRQSNFLGTCLTQKYLSHAIVPHYGSEAVSMQKYDKERHSRDTTQKSQKADNSIKILFFVMINANKALIFSFYFSSKLNFVCFLLYLQKHIPLCREIVFYQVHENEKRMSRRKKSATTIKLSSYNP